MNLLLQFVAGAVVSFGVWSAARPMCRAPVLQRTNYRGSTCPSPPVVLVASAIAVEAVWSAVGGAPSPASAVEGGPSALLVLVLACGFGLLGAFDDVAAHGDDRGFKGHLLAMARGSLSTGGLKLVAGGLLAVVVVAPDRESGSLFDLALGAALVALAANLGNLFDRAPGRTTKVALLVGLLLALLTPGSERVLLSGTVLILGAGAGLLLPDLREELMLGDAGSNVLGAAVGLGAVLTFGRTAEAITVLVLLALNVASEKVSFSKVIASVGPLRALDLLGRRTPPPAS